MPSKQLITIIHNTSQTSVDTFHILQEKLVQLGYQVSTTFNPQTSLIISIGGDGSFLRAIHQCKFPSIPIIGINTGHLGFFAEIGPDDIDEFIDSYDRGDYFLEYLTPVEATICTHTDCITSMALNEIVIKGNKSRTIHMDISVNQNLIQRFSGDGILVCNSQGSTAYNYSAGGSIVDPALNVLQVTPLAPINTTAYRSFTSSVILSPTSKIKVNPEYHYEDSILVVSDGNEYRYNGITEVSVQLAQIKVPMLRMKNFEFWSKVKEKFL